MAKKPAAGEKGDKGAEALGGVAATPAGTAAIKRAAGGTKTAVTKAVVGKKPAAKGKK